MTCLNDPTHVRSNILILASLERLLSVEQIRNTADSALRCWGVGGCVGLFCIEKKKKTGCVGGGGGGGGGVGGGNAYVCPCSTDSSKDSQQPHPQLESIK